VRIKVRGGTVDHGQRPLCESCRFATVIRGAKLGNEIVECDQAVVPQPAGTIPGYVVFALRQSEPGKFAGNGRHRLGTAV
jgi:hypothetical protein